MLQNVLPRIERQMTRSEPRLVAVTGVMSGEVFLLAERAVSLGREPSNALCFPDPALSRRQCTFTMEDGAWTVTNLSSSNGTFVNGLQVSTHRLAEGDRIAVGGSILLFVETARASPAALADEPSDIGPNRRPPAATKYLSLPGSSERLSRTEQGLRALLRLSTVIHSARTERTLYSELLGLLTEVMPVNAAAVILKNAEGALEVVHGDIASVTIAVEPNASIVQKVLREQTGILTHLAAGNGRPAAPKLCVPVVLGDGAAGVIYLDGRGAAFDDEDLQLLTAVARLTSTALENVRRFETLEKETERLKGDLQLVTKLVGESPPMARLQETIRRVSRADTSVLIAGETGTGKELVARAIHMNSPRANRPFVAVNCAALAETLLESELFGHERGAFSGAILQKKGRIELAESGTLFLDEIGELAPAMQSKLLRVLQEREFERVGGTRTIKVNIRLVSATNRDLGDEVKAGRFRADLLYRLNVVRLDMPPLRERASDVPKLASHFLELHRAKVGRRVNGISAAAMACLQAYDWPGNVRELENTIERAAVLGSTEQILPEDLPDCVIEASAAAGTPADKEKLHAAVIETKKKAIIDAFKTAGGNYNATARALGIHTNYLHRLIKNLGIKSQLTGGE